MTKFEEWFKQYGSTGWTDGMTYTVKPMLRDAFNAGRATKEAPSALTQLLNQDPEERMKDLRAAAGLGEVIGHAPDCRCKSCNASRNAKAGW